MTELVSLGRPVYYLLTHSLTSIAANRVHALEPLFGLSFTGLANLGNRFVFTYLYLLNAYAPTHPAHSCYIASTLQALILQVWYDPFPARRPRCQLQPCADVP